MIESQEIENIINAFKKDGKKGWSHSIPRKKNQGHSTGFNRMGKRLCITFFIYIEKIWSKLHIFEFFVKICTKLQISIIKTRAASDLNRLRLLFIPFVVAYYTFASYFNKYSCSSLISCLISVESSAQIFGISSALAPQWALFSPSG